MLIKQPNGLFAEFKIGKTNFEKCNATPEQILEHRINALRLVLQTELNEEMQQINEGHFLSGVDYKEALKEMTLYGSLKYVKEIMKKTSLICSSTQHLTCCGYKQGACILHDQKCEHQRR